MTISLNNNAFRKTITRTAILGAFAFASIAGTMLPISQAQAAAPQVKTQAPGFYRTMLGDFEITVLSDGTATIPLDQLLTNTTPAQVSKLLGKAHLDPQHVETSINAFLVNTGSQLLLVDTGAGELFGPAQGGRLVASLKAAGYQPEDIDAVLLTHIHADHSGGLTVKGKAVFPKALVYVDKHDADFWLNASNESKAADDQKHGFAQAAAAFAPYVENGKLRPFNGNTELFPGVSTMEMAGHTPGHSFYVFQSKGQKMVAWGDVIHAKDVQFEAPGVTIHFDVDANAAASQRKKAFADAEKQGYLIAAAHISFPGIGHIARNSDGKSFAWIPANYSVAGLKQAVQE
ncbi:MBL fold metallo-hydrolase [Undibacterium terreum]|uniref:MBL fold metallo-hydrolase n=1 Tax=Undibacterium terreum TaxID=1224302 RepID=A0A916UCA2_9BURK|nr:MBL fold metallo-hydrolase [Undibacterium terreum]GGC67102.1 MBL fold metallo-hydrolase [Undibacterium terreum]